MDVTRAILYSTLIISVYQQAQAASGSTSSLAEMRDMLTRALAVNRRLDMQNKRLMRVWSGLEQMCKTLDISPDEPQEIGEDATTVVFEQKVLEQKVGSSNADSFPLLHAKEALAYFAALEASNNAADVTEVDNPDPPLHIRSVRSSGGDIVNLTVTYTAPEEHSTDWFATLDFNGQLRSAGNRQYHSNSVYTVYESYYEPEVLQAINFRLHAGHKTVNLIFNLADLDDAGTQTLPEYPGDIVFSQQQYNAADDLDVEIVATLPEALNPAIISEGLFVFFSGLDYSVYPLEMFRYSNYDTDVMTVTGHESDENGSSTVNVTIKSDYASNGGLLTIRPPRMEKIGGYVLQLSYEQYVTITSSNSNDVIRHDEVALYPLDKTTVIASNEYSLWCAATGNPKPEVKLLRQLPSGQTKEKKTQVVLADNFTTIVTSTLAFNDKRKGLYICSATSGSRTVEETTEVVFYREVVMNSAASRVVKNNSEEVRLICKATGIPRPAVEVRLDNPEGLYLHNWTTNAMVATDTTPKSSMLIVTIAKPVPDWPKIFCVGRQQYMNTTKSLQIFPRMNNTDTVNV